MTAEHEVKPRRRARPGTELAESPAQPHEETSIVAAAEGAMAAVPSVDGETVALSKSVVGGVRAGSATVEQGIVGGALAGSVHLRQSIARTVVAQRVEVAQSYVRSILANEVHVRPSTNIGILLARRVEGDVKVLLDWRGAAILGVIAGLVGGLVRGGRRRRR